MARNNGPGPGNNRLFILKNAKPSSARTTLQKAQFSSNVWGESHARSEKTIS